jgi:hypothetical protein
MKIEITCDECGGTVVTEYDEGEPRIVSGPPDSWYPGSPPSVYIVEGCDCPTQLTEEELFEAAAQEQESWQDYYENEAYDRHHDR